MKQNQVEKPPDERTATRPATQCGGSSGSGVQQDDVTSDTVMQTADKKLPEVPDVVMDGGDSCEAQLKRAKTIMGLEVRVLEAQHDVYDDTTEELTNLAETSGENVTDEDAVSTEVTGELDRLKALGRPYKAPTVEELMPRGPVHSQKTNEQLDARMAAEGRERELSTLCAQDALFVIPRTALRPGNKTARRRFVDDMKGDRVESRRAKLCLVSFITKNLRERADVTETTSLLKAVMR